MVPANIPPEIQQLIQDFAVVFEKPQGLPPPRSFAHQIPLLPGAKPIFIRPFRYAVVIKDEIEKQVSEMLESGIIQHSTSPVSSPVLLVKKKRNTTLGGFVWITNIQMHSQLRMFTLFQLLINSRMSWLRLVGSLH